MLSPESAVPLLWHEEGVIRYHAAVHFADGHLIPPVSSDDVWRVIDRYGINRNQAHHFWVLGRLPLGDSDAQRIIQTIREARAVSAPLWADRAARGLTVPAARKLLDTPAAATLPAETRNRMRKRVEYAELDFDELWSRLVHDADVEAEGNYVGGFDMSVSDCLLEALARHPERALRSTRSILEDESRVGSWLELYAIQLAGHLRAPEFIDRLIDVVGEDGDYANERAVDSLVSIGTVDVVNAVRATYPESGWDFRNFSPAVLGRIHRPESELALIELLALEKDESNRTNLAQALCDLFTTEGIEVVHRMAADGAYDGGMVDLRGLLAEVCAATGVTIPEMDDWLALSRKEWGDFGFETPSLAPLLGKSVPTSKSLGWVPTSKKRKKKGKKKR